MPSERCEGWFSDDLDIHLVDVPITQAVVNAMVKGAPVAWVPRVSLLPQNGTRVTEALSDLYIGFPS